jgi:hypothetical protein
LEFYGRHNGRLSPHPPGDASVFVRKKYLPFVSETLDLTSRLLLKEIVLGVFDFAEVIAGGSKNKTKCGLYVKFFAKLIGENRNRLAFLFCEIFEKNERGSRKRLFNVFVQQFSRQLLHLKIF